MTGPELRVALAELGLTRAELARLTGKDIGTVFRWLRDEDADGALDVPRYVETIIDLMRAMAERLDRDKPGALVTLDAFRAKR